MSNAVIVITHLWNTDFQHWWGLYFDPPHAPWYTGQVWGNIFAILPAAILGYMGYWIHKVISSDVKKFDARAAHDAHMRHLQAIVDALDPAVASDSVLDMIADRVDEETPSGIGTLRDELKKLQEARDSGDDPAA